MFEILHEKLGSFLIQDWRFGLFSLHRFFEKRNRILISLLKVLVELGLLETGPLQVGALCLHWSTEGNLRKFFWWYTIFEWQSFRCGILETMADIYLGVVVGLGSMYFLSDFWRALSWHSAPTLNLLLSQEGASSKVLLLVFHCRENVLRFLFAFGSSQIFHQIKIVFL